MLFVDAFDVLIQVVKGRLHCAAQEVYPYSCNSPPLERFPNGIVPFHSIVNPSALSHTASGCHRKA
eukprot:3267673-Pleurochrysis_carterae.AAC.1